MITIASRAETLVNEARAIHAAATTEQRDLHPAERERYDALMDQARRALTDAEKDAEFRSALGQLLGPQHGDTRPVVYAHGGPADRPGPRRETRAGGTRTEHATMLPSFGEYRAAQAEGTDSLGGFTVPEQVASTIVDRLRAGSVFLQAQPQIFTMTSDTLRIPKIGTSASVAMVLENAPIPESNLVFDAAALTARKVAGLMRSSNEWLSDSVPNARQIVEQDLMRELGQKLDEQFFGGNGTPPNMQGLLTHPDVTPTNVGGAIALDAIALGVEAVETAGGTPSAIFMGPLVFSVIRRLKDADQRYQLNPDPTGEARKRLFGLDVYLTPYLSNAVLIIDMRQIAVGVRDKVTLFYDDGRYAEYDQSLIRLTARFDIGVLNADAIHLLTGITF